MTRKCQLETQRVALPSAENPIETLRTKLEIAAKTPSEEFMVDIARHKKRYGSKKLPSFINFNIICEGIKPFGSCLLWLPVAYTKSVKREGTVGSNTRLVAGSQLKG